MRLVSEADALPRCWRRRVSESLGGPCFQISFERREGRPSRQGARCSGTGTPAPRVGSSVRLLVTALMWRSPGQAQAGAPAVPSTAGSTDIPDEMADRHLIENREAAIGVQMFHMRKRWGTAVWRAQTQTQVLLGRLKCALPGWEEAESRRAANTAAEASCRSHDSGSGDGGGLGGDSSWGAGYGGDVGRVDRR
jgi:hypothetical protein